MYYPRMIFASHNVAPKPTALLSAPLIAMPALLPAFVFVKDVEMNTLRMILLSASFNR